MSKKFVLVLFCFSMASALISYLRVNKVALKKRWADEMEIRRMSDALVEELLSDGMDPRVLSKAIQIVTDRLENKELRVRNAEELRDEIKFAALVVQF